MSATQEIARLAAELHTANLALDMLREEHERDRINITEKLETILKLRSDLATARDERNMLASKCHATLAGWAPSTLDWDAARLCRRYMGLPEPWADHLTGVTLPA